MDPVCLGAGCVDPVCLVGLADPIGFVVDLYGVRDGCPIIPPPLQTRPSQRQPAQTASRAGSAELANPISHGRVEPPGPSMPSQPNHPDCPPIAKDPPDCQKEIPNSRFFGTWTSGLREALTIKHNQVETRKQEHMKPVTFKGAKGRGEALLRHLEQKPLVPCLVFHPTLSHSELTLANLRISFIP